MMVYVVSVEATEMEEVRFLNDEMRVFTDRVKAIAYMEVMAMSASKFVVFGCDPERADIDIDEELGNASVSWGDPHTYVDVYVTARELEE